MVKIAWGITGCGDKIEEIAALMVELKRKHDLKVDIYVSKNAVMVLKWYKLWDMLKDEFFDIRTEVNANSPFLVGKLQTGDYDLFLVAPVTANSTAKIAHGIADTLITNAVSQAAKAIVPIYLFRRIISPASWRPSCREATSSRSTSATSTWRTWTRSGR